MLETVSNPSEWEKNFFDADKEYPAILTGITAESISEDDCNVIFTFLVNNGYMNKECIHICKNVFTKGKYRFRKFCELLLYNPEWEDDEEYQQKWKEMQKTADLNEQVGYATIVSVIDLSSHAEVTYILQSYFHDFEYDEWDFDALYSAINEDTYKPEVPQKVNDLLHEIFFDADLKDEFTKSGNFDFYDIIADGNVPF